MMQNEICLVYSFCKFLQEPSACFQNTPVVYSKHPTRCRELKTPILGVNFYQIQVTECTRYTNISAWPKPHRGAWNWKHLKKCFGKTSNASMEYTNPSAHDRKHSLGVFNNLISVSDSIHQSKFFARNKFWC